MSSSLRTEARALLGLALPVVGVNLGISAMGLVDTAMIGRTDVVQLAAVALGSLYFFWLTQLGMGVLFALDPIVAQAHARGRHDEVRSALRRGVVLALALSVPTMAAMVPATAVLEGLRQPAESIPFAVAYVHGVLVSVPALLLFVACRQTLQAMHLVRPVFIVMVLGNLLNAGLNWVLIYGKFGFPRLEAYGCALASTVSRWAVCLGLFALAWSQLGPHLRGGSGRSVTLDGLREMLRIGLPVGAQRLLEMGAFGSIVLFMGWIGNEEVAGHQIALHWAGTSFMLAVGVGSAAAVRVGRAVGLGDAQALRRATGVALAVGAGIMLCSASAFIFVPHLFARIFTDEPTVLAVVVVLLPIAGAFQIVDGTQAVATGLLRGAADTRTPMIIHFAGFWLLGIPAGLLLAFPLGFGARGLWWGLVIGLTAVTPPLLLRVRSQLLRSLPEQVAPVTPRARSVAHTAARSTHRASGE